MKYFFDTITSPAYWRYVLFSRVGLQTVLATFGGIWLLVESLDFFGRPLLRTLAARIPRGFLLAVDYGMCRESLLAEHRTGGTLSCYRGHRRDSNPLEAPGEKDITAHVNFSLLRNDAVEAGWNFMNFTDQHHFLVGAAKSLLLSMDGKIPDGEGRRKLRSLRTLLHPESMGQQFHAIVFSKGVAGAKLSGFQYAGESRL